jgi:hypothetical protein
MTVATSGDNKAHIGLTCFAGTAYTSIRDDNSGCNLHTSPVRASSYLSAL